MMWRSRWISELMKEVTSLIGGFAGLCFIMTFWIALTGLEGDESTNGGDHDVDQLKFGRFIGPLLRTLQLHRLQRRHQPIRVPDNSGRYNFSRT